MDMGIIFKVLAALMLAFIWGAYLRKINIFSKVKWTQVLITIFVGGITTVVVILFDLPEFKGVDQQHILTQKLIYYLYNVALMEEVCKFAGLLLVIIIFQRWFREEPNYIIYASLVALGFATVENFIYFYKHGVSIIYMRGMMGTVAHIIGTSIIAGFMVVGLRKNIATAALYSFFGAIVATVIHGLYNFFISLDAISFSIFNIEIKILPVVFFAITILIYAVEIEIWSRVMNNFLNFSRRVNLKKSIDRNTLQRFLLLSFFSAGVIHVAGLLYEKGWEEGIKNNLYLLSLEFIITLILIVRITRFTIIPQHWTTIYPVLPVTIRRGKFQRSIIPTSPRFFLKIRGDEFNEYPFTSLIDEVVKLTSLPQKGIDFDMDVNVKMITKKFIGPKKELYYLCEILDFHTIHPQYNSRYVLIRPKNYGKKFTSGVPIVGLIALKGFVDLDNIGPKDCKFINWMGMKKEGKKKPSQRMMEMLK